MNQSYETSQDSSWEVADPDKSDLDRHDDRPRTLGGVIVGGVAVVGGGALGAGPYLKFVDGSSRTELDLLRWPKPLLLVVLAGVVAVAGLFVLIRPRSTFGNAMMGLLIAPAATVSALQGPPILRQVLRDPGVGGLRIGGWLVAGGTALVLLAALVAFVVMLRRLGPAAPGSLVPVLGAAATAGLLQWWTVSPIEQDGNVVLRYFSVDTGGSVWPGVVVLSALALMIAAVAVSSARSGAAAIGVALGATLAVGLELGARYMVSAADLRRDFDARLRFASSILTVVTAGLLLLLVFGLALATARLSVEAQNAAAAAEWENVGAGQSWATESSGDSGDSSGSAEPWATAGAAQATSTEWPDGSDSWPERDSASSSTSYTRRQASWES